MSNKSKKLSEAEIYREMNEWGSREGEGEGGSLSLVRQCLTYKSKQHP